MTAGTTTGRHGCTIRRVESTTESTSGHSRWSRQRPCRSIVVPPTGFEPVLPP
jgi:hypothetical protein